MTITASSLSRAVGGRMGLSEGEIIEFLAAPNRKPDEFVTALEKLKEHAWYLHREEQRYFVKDTENLSRKIERNARDIPQPKIDQALINRLTGILQPVSKAAYQELKVLPMLDEIRLTGPRVLIVVRPDGKLPPQQLHQFFLFQQEKNNLLVLSGQDSHFADVVEERLRELYAVEQIVKHLKDGDTLFEEARDRFEDGEQRFMKALSAAYNRIYFPGIDETTGEDVLLLVTIDNGLKVGAGDQSAEKQIEDLLASPRANYKLNGSNPKEGNRYEAPFEIGGDAYRLLVYAKAGEAAKNAEFSIPASGDKRVQIDDGKPAKLPESKRVNLDSTEKVFAVINRFRGRDSTLLKGVRIQIGEGENTVQIRFHERRITAQMIEETINSLRKVLNRVVIMNKAL